MTNTVSSCVPKNQSKKSPVGNTKGYKPHSKNLISGVHFSAITNYEGPVHNAYGIISPTNTTNIVDIKTAYAAGTI